MTLKVAPVKEPEQPVGKVKPVLTEKFTAPVNPLIGVTTQVEDPAGPPA